MTPLPIKKKDYLSLIDQPICVFGCGVITSFNESENTFVIHGTHKLSVHGPTDDFVITCQTNINPTWRQTFTSHNLP